MTKINNNSQPQSNSEEYALFHEIAADIKANSDIYHQAGKWLDSFYDETKVSSVMTGFGNARKELEEKYKQQEFIPEEDSKKILLITWFLTDPDAENANLNITKFEKWKWEPTNDVTKFSRSFAAALFAKYKDSWMKLVNIAWHKIVTNRQHLIKNSFAEGKEHQAEPQYKRIGTIIWVIIAAIIFLLGGLWTAIQIYESKTFKNIFHLPDKKAQILAEKKSLDDYGRTPLYARTQKRVEDIYEKIENEKLNPWLFINAGVKVQITEYNGKVISYEGVTFEGAPRLVFWSDDFIPPFIEDAIIKVFDQTIEECRKNNLDPKPYISEAKSLLCGFINKVYSRMADIDQKLSSKGDLKNAGRKDVSYEFNKMNECLKKHYDAAILLASQDRN